MIDSRVKPENDYLYGHPRAGAIANLDPRAQKTIQPLKQNQIFVTMVPAISR